jgi:PAS domain S-box-containing protein
MYHIFGIDQDSFTGVLTDVTAQSIHPDDRDKVEQANRSVSEQGKPIPLEYRIIHSDGSIHVVWGEAGELVLDEEGNPSLLSGIVQDVTERKQAEEEIRHHLNELQVLYENGLVIGSLLDIRKIGDRIIAVFEQYLSWHHVTIRLRKEDSDDLYLVAFNLPNLLTEEDRVKAERIFSTNITKVGQGLSGWAIQTGQPIRTGNVHLYEQYMDVNQGNIQSGVYMPLKIGERITGVISVESEEVDAFTEQDERLLATLGNQAAVAFENARLYWIAQQEISQRKQMENLLADERNLLAQRVEERTADLSRVNSDLEHALRVRDEFLASMSHELRTPLTGILGLSEVLQLGIYGELSDKQQKALSTIEESGRHLLDLINDILDLSRIEAGNLELRLVPCSIEDICQASLHLAKGMANKRKQNMNYSPAGKPLFVLADARRFKQILVNLLSNAIKFTPESGELGLEVQANDSDGIVRLTVWDKGIGIKPEDFGKLFKPFVQIDGTLAREYSGTGLGLSLVQNLTELHNGGIEFESVFGKGSRFTVVLPLIPPNNALISITPTQDINQLPNLAAPFAQFKTPLIMLADDNEISLQMIADYLEAKQARVMKVRSGAELLEKVSDFHPDIMLVDIQMPGMDGLETIHRIRSHPDPQVAATPVIAVTALAMVGDRELCLSAGANEYMSKPVRINELTAAIQRFLEDKQ